MVYLSLDQSGGSITHWSARQADQCHFHPWSKSPKSKAKREASEKYQTVFLAKTIFGVTKRWMFVLEENSQLGFGEETCVNSLRSGME